MVKAPGPQPGDSLPRLPIPVLTLNAARSRSGPPLRTLEMTLPDAHKEPIMTQKTLSSLAQSMRGIDIAMLTTTSEGGTLASRPMSNNGQVDYDGTSYYFTYDQSRTVRDI
jgi:Pyridoxamine 5'-phosphate oxidase like